MSVRRGGSVGVIQTIRDKCKRCYACVRNCPVKAVKVEAGQAQVIPERCISCGNCVKACAQKAKSVARDVERVYGMLSSTASGRKVVACLAPTFAAAFPDADPLAVVTAVRALGFSEVWEVARGAEAVAAEYARYLAERGGGVVISSACPAVVNLVEQHFPSLIPMLAPVVSPMVAAAREIKAELPGAAVVFIGPCTAKKDEYRQEAVAGAVDAVLTFTELAEMLKAGGIDVPKLPPGEFDGPADGGGRAFPISGGLARNIGMLEDIAQTGVIVTEGKDNCIEVMKSLVEGKITAGFIDLLFCRGCVDGPEFPDKHDVFERRQTVLDFIARQCERAVHGASKMAAQERRVASERGGVVRKRTSVSLRRKFSARSVPLPIPDPLKVREVLLKTGKSAPEDELNCGACGYESCREKATAVAQGIAEIDMCLPYLLDEKTREVELVRQLNQELDGIIESSYDGIYVTDGNGVLLRANAACKRLLGVQVSEVAGKHVTELEKAFFPTVTLLVLKERRRVTILEETRTGRKILATGNPVFSSDGSIERVVTNVRDLSELAKVQLQMNENEHVKKHYHPESKNFLGQELEPVEIVAYSPEMGEVLELATKVAKVNSTVLIMGESGVGKEVVARYIHRTGIRKDGPFVKINCGAIPETLLESELFGYETGAFTGAKKEGKPGLIELAGGGTLFLDEIAELPLGLQAKLLQVLQEKKLVRIGGTSPISVDTRIIAATNRNLQAMVKEGTFRSDLYYRLNVVPITVPPLRERHDDIVPLIYHFLAKYNLKYDQDKEISAEAKDLLVSYPWPGNVRELENIIERLVVTVDGPVIGPGHIPENVRTGGGPGRPKVFLADVLPLKDAVEELERQLITKAMEQNASTYKIAELLGVNQSTVVRKIQKYLKSERP